MSRTREQALEAVCHDVSESCCDHGPGICLRLAARAALALPPDAPVALEGFEGATPGPWSVRRMRVHDAIESEHVAQICTVGLCKGPGRDSEADARLIAAAPALAAEVAALRKQNAELRERLDCDDLSHYRRSEAALKARVDELESRDLEDWIAYFAEAES